MFRYTSEQNIEAGEEGCVVYFVKNSHPSQPVLLNYEEYVCKDVPLEFPEEEFVSSVRELSTISMGKMKTLEYRIYRKLREKLKSTKNTDTNKLFSAFVS